MDRTLHELIADRVREPRDDLVSTLVSLTDGERAFSHDEVAGLVALIVFRELVVRPTWRAPR